MKGAKRISGFGVTVQRKQPLVKRSVLVVAQAKKANRPKRPTIKAKRPRKRLVNHEDPDYVEESIIRRPSFEKGTTTDGVSQGNSDTHGSQATEFSKVAKSDAKDGYPMHNSMNNLSNGMEQMAVQQYNKEMQKCVKRRDINGAVKWFGAMKREGVEPNVFNYTTLMNGYLRVGDDEKVFELFDEMIGKRIMPDVVTFTTLIHACAMTGNLTKAEELFIEMQASYGIQPEVRTFGALSNVCAKAGNLSKAREYFTEMKKKGIRRDVVAFTSMIDAYAEATNGTNGSEHLKECLELLETMRKEGAPPNCQSYSSIIKLCVRAGMLKEAREMLHEMDVYGIPPDVYTYNTLIHGYSASDEFSSNEILAEVDVLLTRMRKQGMEPCGATYGSLFNVCLKVEDLGRAQAYYEEAKKKRTPLKFKEYGALLRCYERLGNAKNKEQYLGHCFGLVAEMERTGVSLDAPAYTTLISACANGKDLDSALGVWEKMKRNQVKLDGKAFGAMIKACLTAKTLPRAFDLLDEMDARGIDPKERTLFMLFAYCELTEKQSKAKQLYQRMKVHSLQPSDRIRGILSSMNIL